MEDWPMAGMGPNGTANIPTILKNNGGSSRLFCFWKELKMNLISNIWNHPKTSTAGLLIAVITIAGVLSRQGITMGAAGTGTVVTLVGAIATALLGLLSRDPGGESSSTGATA